MMPRESPTMGEKLTTTWFTVQPLFGGLGIGLTVLALMLPSECFQVLTGSAIVGILGLIVKS